MLNKIREYLELKIGGGTSYIKYSSMDRLPTIGAIIFDCDGVLIDEKTSYCQTIKDVTAYLTTLLTGFEIDKTLIPSETIYRIRSVGSFNNDCDTISLLVEWLTERLSRYGYEDLLKRLEALTGKTVGEIVDTLKKQQTSFRVSEETVANWFKELERLVSNFEGTAATLIKIEEELGMNSEAVKLLKKILKYPGRYGESLLATVFDEAFFGSDVISQLRQQGPYFDFDGRIKNEKLLVEEETLKTFSEKGIKLGISTGRGSWETWKTLGHLSEYFEKKACIFVGDAILNQPHIREVFEKPSPWSLVEAFKNINHKGTVLYVGNSVEDYIMFEKAQKDIVGLLFAGVYGDRYELADFFIEKGADLVIHNVNQLPKIIGFLEES